MSEQTKTLEERVAVIEAELEHLPRIMAEFENQVSALLRMMQESLGVFVLPTETGFNIKIQSPSKKATLGVVSSIYWELQDIKKKLPQENIVLATQMPKRA